MLRVLFGLRSVRGLADILSGSVRLGVVSQELLEPKMFAVVPVPPDSAELLKPKRVSRFLGRVCERFDCMLRTSSSGLAPDTANLAMRGDPLLLAVDAQKHLQLRLRCASRQSKRNPEAVKAKVIGTTMVNVRHSRMGYR